MPLLNWSPGALSALKSTDKRKEMTRLFEAYSRVGLNDALINTVLHLDLPSDRENRYHFLARFRKTTGWVVEAELKHEHRKIRFNA